MPQEVKEEIAERLHDEVADWYRNRQEQLRDNNLHWYKRMVADLFKPSQKLVERVGLEENREGGAP